MKKNKITHNKHVYVITEDEAYEIEGMLSVLALIFWNILKKKELNKDNLADLRTKFYNQVYKYINQS